jgi:5-methylcytosine-specific restriction endonuclease McrA
MKRTNIKDNMEKILNGEMKITFVPAFRDRIKKEKLLGEPKCAECGITDLWNGKSLSLELDHINGDKHNNTRENLRYLCPNCHSQTNTFRVKNYNPIKSTKRKWVKDEDLIKSIKQGGSIADILRRANLKPVGDNYNRVHRLKIKYNI